MAPMAAPTQTLGNQNPSLGSKDMVISLPVPFQDLLDSPKPSPNSYGDSSSNLLLFGFL